MLVDVGSVLHVSGCFVAGELQSGLGFGVALGMSFDCGIET